MGSPDRKSREKPGESLHFPSSWLATAAVRRSDAAVHHHQHNVCSMDAGEGIRIHSNSFFGIHRADGCCCRRTGASDHLDCSCSYQDSTLCADFIVHCGNCFSSVAYRRRLTSSTLNFLLRRLHA